MINVDQLLAIVDDLTTFTTSEQLEERLSQCQTAYDQLKDVKTSERATMLLAAIAKIRNKIAAMKFAERRKAQRAIRAAATIPQEEVQ